MLTAQIEEFNQQTYNELSYLLINHYDEISVHGKNGYKLNPWMEKYYNQANEDILLYITLRDEGKLKGYFLGTIYPCMHYQIMTLTLDIIYVVNDSRGFAGGKLLMDCAHKEWKRRKGKMWRMGYKVEHSKYMAALLDGYGFESYEVHKVLWAKDD